MSARLMAIASEGDRRRIYLSPTERMERIASQVKPDWMPEVPLTGKCRVNVSNYGMDSFGDLFSNRQLAALTTFSGLVQVVHDVVEKDAVAAGASSNPEPFCEGGIGARAYADAVAVYLAFVVQKLTESHSTICTWSAAPKNELVVSTFRRQALPMTWDFAEANPFGDSSGSIAKITGAVARVISTALSGATSGHAHQADAASQAHTQGKVVSTDPPYYDNIAYADLSDFFYSWLRKPVEPIFPDLFATVAVPKAEELVATPNRHGGREQAEAFFIDGMTNAMQRIVDQALSAFPVTIYYAYKQAETGDIPGTASTGWETFLEATIRAGFAVSGTWPVRTEREGRSIGIGANALASSIVLVCRPRSTDANPATRREFLAALKEDLPKTLAHLQTSNIAPVDLAQAAIGPGMAVFTRFARVLEADDSQMSARSALQLINQVVDEVFSEEEQDLDPDTRFALTWFESHGFEEGAYGEAETLAKARGVAVSGVQEAGLLRSAAGKVRLLSRAELAEDWDPVVDDRLTVWEATQHLIKRLEEQGEGEAAALRAKLGTIAEKARSLAYRLYTTCERKKWAEEAQAYNGLVLAWPELEKLASEAGPSAEPETQAELFE